eukprot:423814_1
MTGHFTLICIIICTICIKRYQSISCGQSASGSIADYPQTDVHMLTILNTSDVNLNSCESATDITIFVMNDLNETISDLSCYSGDDCGYCSNNQTYRENFTVSHVSQGIYTIHISAFDLGGSYHVDIECTDNLSDVDDHEQMQCVPDVVDQLDTLKCGVIFECTHLNRLPTFFASYNNEENTYDYPFARDFLVDIDHNTNVLFHGCHNQNDYRDVTLEITSTDYTTINGGKFLQDYDFYYPECNDAGQILLIYLRKGKYTLRVVGIGTDEQHNSSFTLSIFCDFPHLVLDTTNYILSDGLSSITQYSWKASELICEALYGTTLATIHSEEQWNEVTELLNGVNWDYLVTFEPWIGQWQSDGDAKWKWIDNNGTLIFNSSQYRQCNWGYPPRANGYNSALGAFLIPDLFNRPNVCARGSKIDTTDEELKTWFLCNAPKNKTEQCGEPFECWKNTNILIQQVLPTNGYEYWYSMIMHIAYWKSKLFVLQTVDLQKYGEPNYTQWNLLTVTVSDFSLENDAIKWRNHTLYGQFKRMFLKNYAQYKEMLYLLVMGWAEDKPDADFAEDTRGFYIFVIHLNLENMQTEQIIFPTNFNYGAFDFISMLDYHPTIKCMAADAKHIYISTDTLGFTLFIYEIYSKLYTIVPLVFEPFDCTLNEDGTYLYLFSDSDEIYRYEIDTVKLEKLLTKNICKFWNMYQRTVVLAGNGNIFLQGCYVTSFETVVFNTRAEMFETMTIATNTPPHVVNIDTIEDILTNDGSVNTDMSSLSELEVVLMAIDDNILLMIHSDWPWQIYYTVTNEISVNFTNTVTDSIWPSDGFDLKYYVNDFNTNNTWYRKYWLTFDSEIINANINIELNVINDNCKCDAYYYQCYACVYHFDLFKYLTTKHNNLTEFDFLITSSLSRLLIRPSSLSIKLTRCEIKLNNNNNNSDSANPIVRFDFELSKECYIRRGIKFSMNITENQAKIAKELIINIGDDNTYSCWLCEMNKSNHVCDVCESNYFLIRHDTLKNHATLMLKFESNMIDFAVNTGTTDSIFNVPFVKNNPNEYSLPTWVIPSIVIIGIVVLSLILFGIYTYRKWKIEQERRIKFEQKIHNPMVICIGIEWYQDSPKNPQISGVCPNLNGIQRDHENIEILCEFYGYKFIKREQFEWTQAEMIDFLEEKAKYFAKNLDEYEEKDANRYDSLMVVVSGHGLQNGIITSDYQVVNKTAVHRLFTTNYPSTREMPRIFIFDCCDGEQERSHYIAKHNPNDSESDDDDQSNIPKDNGKNFAVNDIKINQYDDELWKKDQKNPDYRVSLIHAANEGFQAKMNSIDGSYLIYEFVKRMIANVKEEKNLFLGEIFDSIQQDLHDQGKQQITAVWNNNSRYLRFKKCDSESKENVIEDNIGSNTTNVSEIKQQQTPVPQGIEMGKVTNDTKTKTKHNNDIDDILKDDHEMIDTLMNMT